ncbi:MAG: hypothetical protein O8C62_09970 [Candidatus Methanoperedens sp.]|nr:hypothetical protein [Candidatus Methanoperedens sp.]
MLLKTYETEFLCHVSHYCEAIACCSNITMRHSQTNTGRRNRVSHAAGGYTAAMAARVVELLENEVLRQSLRARAAEDARRRFDIERMVDEYLG